MGGCHVPYTHIALLRPHGWFLCQPSRPACSCAPHKLRRCHQALQLPPVFSASATVLSQFCHHLPHCSWEFDGSGACVRIPQIGDEQASSAARASQRACVASYPCMEAQGLIWVWAESGPSAAAEAAATPPPLLPELEEGGSGDAEQPPWEASTQWFFRDVPQ